MSLQAHLYGMLGAHLLSVGTPWFELMRPWRNNQKPLLPLDEKILKSLPQACPGEDKVKPSCFLLSSPGNQGIAEDPDPQLRMSCQEGVEKGSLYMKHLGGPGLGEG